MERNTTSGREPRVLDHVYDGIQEFDNPTPGWWHGLFWASILFALFYVSFFHFSEFAWSVQDEHEQAVAAYYKKLFGTLGELKPDEATVSRMMGEEKWLTVGKGVFASNCAQCHAADGGGINGPNLTDEQYINIKKLGDLFPFISTGNVPKGMPAWENRLQVNERILVAASVATLRGTRPATPKAPEGEAIPAWPKAPAPTEAPAPAGAKASATP